MAGIIVEMPGIFINTFQQLLLGSTYETWQGGLMFAGFVLVYLLIIIGVIFVQEAERKITIQYANKSTSSLGKQTYMPIKINSAGVIPVIFASSLLAVPITIAQFLNNESFSNFVNSYLDFTTPVGLVLYILLILFFDYFYTFVQMKPDQMAKNLKDNGGYIPGIRPGDDTKKFISKVLSRLTVLGATFLVIIAGLPIIFSKVTSLPTSVSIGGTGLLIVVGVLLETYKQIEGEG